MATKNNANGCLSKRKDTNFKANHNKRSSHAFGTYDVCLSAKIRILKQITTNLGMQPLFNGCLSKRKDTNFKANHNVYDEIQSPRWDVCLSAKIRILKQITTRRTCSRTVRLMSVFDKDTDFKAFSHTGYNKFCVSVLLWLFASVVRRFCILMPSFAI